MIGHGWAWMNFQGAIAMYKSFTGAKVLCPTCKTRVFIQNQPWKLQCVTCYLARKAKATPTARYAVTTAPIDQAMLRRLVQLCHPDRHGNSEAANIATSWLLELKHG